ncbi:hypothetical protein IQ254_14645 [Nodosilinea sp. LEGE 07088]|uniref:hypothetical protein n=1 Tax=Nodosilinea sp. LEGE 07088 TaxID=2777968 RepID=UPI00187F1DC9|nr:hypothetical protein [Nodosilinea sp. LEGE 07088]MBE9138412.1 hypothetical protein [Nodosilinea sp. LEGE 07088]
MPQAFLPSNLPITDTHATVTIEPTTEPGREKVLLTVTGSAYAIERVIHELYRVGFAEVREWSKPIPTGKVNEVMRVLTRYVIME